MKFAAEMTGPLSRERDPWANFARSPTLPLGIGLIALLLRLHDLAAKPFWFDEVLTFWRVTGSLHHLLTDSFENRHYPTYFLLVWLVAKLGHSPVLLRLPSAVFGAVAASLACVTGRRAANARSGAIAGLLMAFSPFEVQFGQEARSYTLVSMLILVALWGLVKLAQEVGSEHSAEPGSGSAWLAYAAGTAGALDTLGVGMPWLLAANAAAFGIAYGAGEKRRAFWRRWGLVQIVILAAWLPLLIGLLLLHKEHLTQGASWAPPETLEGVWSTLAPVYLLRISKFVAPGMLAAAVPALSLVVAGLALLGAWRLRREPALLAVLGCAALVLPASLLLVSPFVPLLVARYFAWGAAPFFILAGAGFGLVPGKFFGVLATGLAAACLVNLRPYYGYETKPRWDLAAKDVANLANPGDVVLADCGYAYYIFPYFADRAKLAAQGLNIAYSLKAAQKAAAGHDVWALYGRSGQSAIEPAASYLASLAPLGKPIADFRVGRYITVYRFREPPPAHPDSGPQEASRP